MHRILLFLACSCLLLAAQPAAAKDSPLFSAETDADADPVSTRVVWSADGAHPGDSLAAAVVFEIRDGYHIMANDAQARKSEEFTPFPTRVELAAASEGVLAEAARYPQATPFKADFAAEDVMSFEGRTPVFVPLRVDSHAAPGTASLTIRIQYQACSETFCLLPQKKTMEAVLPVVAPGEPTRQTDPELFAALRREAAAPDGGGVRFDLFGWSFTLPMATGWEVLLLLAAAAAGGFLLNFTPCVLPLIPIKIVSMSSAASHRGRCLALGVFTFLGVLGFWLALGTLVSAVSGFSATNQLFHYPAFTIGVGLVIGVMAAGMFEAFSLRLPQWIFAFNPAQQTLHGSFGVGILTAVLSTPCTAPFMGTAAAWAATRDPAVTLTTFSAIGAGMGVPYLLLAAAPGLVRRIPKSGPASGLLKEVMGIFMLAAAAYFIGIGISVLALEPGAPPSRSYWWPVAACSAAAGLWLALRTFRLAPTRTLKLIWMALGGLIAAAALLGALKLTDTGPIPWVYYTPEKLEAAFAERKPVVVLFTAEWCLNCKALEQSVWRDERLVALIRKGDAVPIKVDLTAKNPAGKQKLAQSGSLTIPLLVVYAPDGRPVFKSDFYNAEQVREAIETLQGDARSGS
jgi:thiol:disulfide interchange protein DsbD